MSWREAFEGQAASCGRLGSPFMARMLRLAPDAMPEGALKDRFRRWPEQAEFWSGATALRLAGGLHALVRQGDPLAAAYPPNDVSDAALSAALRDAMAREEGFLLQALESPPQTNEVRRSAALIPALHLLSARHGLPLALSELGASAGLNLLADRFALETPAGRLGPAGPVLTLRPDWRGPLPAPADLRIAERAGVDLHPIDVADPARRARLLSFLWPDQPRRLAMTEAAIAAGPPLPDRGDAVDWLRRRLGPRPGRLHIVFHTVFRQYLPPDASARLTAVLDAGGARGAPDAPLAHLSMEYDGEGPGAAVVLTTWPGTRELLGRVCFHGLWVDWRVAA
ncbi:hypothetical protein BCF33_2662 [Hasllibacter halocynthiae]|uniref:DUF2332 family protein n=1 Tax=Hasllibacter halocynthiae TaxID=595589 RepID=A0A2T0X4A6_9RHOB|nr:DUF2332 family protein [Hasllibacter halocynthiae]PRY93778.1 hypothetical protein BCF33_2662 [Hasllibacter halocynthiae]